MTWAEIQKGHIKRLEWAIWLSQVDLTALRGGDWQNLSEDLYDFIQSPGPPQVLYLPPKEKDRFIKGLSQDSIAQIQNQFKADLQRYASKDGAAHTTIQVQDIEFDFVGFGPEQAFIQMIQAKDNVTAARLALGFRLVGAMISSAFIQQCEECSRVFVMRRKPRADVTRHFCSIKCSRNAATRRYREKGKSAFKAKERERSRSKYVKKVKARYPGKKVKVARRPKSKSAEKTED